ncbi:MAG TPA: phosphate signaling complex protein PhoU [Bacillota bacterium]|nr:phosphate signaling complex protein PhoU [Bacillota bacterium]
MEKHINAYDLELFRVRDKLLLMSEKVGECLSEAMKAFLGQDNVLAQSILAGDDVIDKLDEEVEITSLNLISLQQPDDRDLRFLAAAMRIGHELERIGDYACDIAEAASYIKHQEPFFQSLVTLRRMADLVRAMLQKSLQAYMEKNLKSAAQMDDDDNEVDRIFLALFNMLTCCMKQNPEYIEQASAILLVARYLERIGDHVVNIAEMTIFSESGERHPFKVRKNKAGQSS